MLTDSHYLTPLFEPKSLAIIGASEQVGSLGETIVSHVLAGGYRGQLFAVTPTYRGVRGLPTYAKITEIEQKLDMAAIIVDQEHLRSAIEECAQAGVSQAVILTPSPSRDSFLDDTLSAARAAGMRLLGPSSVGLSRPRHHLNLTFARTHALPGSVAVVSQSAALCSAILDWAGIRQVGFSTVMSLGHSLDLDFGEILDYLAYDLTTESILLYVEDVRHPRHFISALRMAANIKPVLVLKGGRSGTHDAMEHDAVFDAVLRRAGVVRLYNLEQFFEAARTQYFKFRLTGNHLAMISNSAGLAALAADRAHDLNIPLAHLAQTTVQALTAEGMNTDNRLVDLTEDANAARFGAALDLCLHDEGVDGALVLVAPQAMNSPTEIAQLLAKRHGQARKPLLVCWIGGEQMAAGRDILQRQGVPLFTSPEPAVETFSQILAYYRNQQLLLEMPGPLSHPAKPHLASARLLISTSLDRGHKTLSAIESKALLATFHIPAARTVLASSVTDALAIAEEIGLPVAMKVHSPNIAHKGEVGGVRLNVRSLAMVQASYQDIVDEVSRRAPESLILGITIEPMIHAPHGRELAIHVTQDNVFGAVITLRAHGQLAAALKSHTVALPPLNAKLAHDLVAASPLWPLLQNYAGMPAVNITALEDVLLRVSEMVCELPWVESLSISPLLLDEAGVIAVDANVTLRPLPTSAGRYDHMIIPPYPTHLESTCFTPTGTQVLLRPIRPEDASMVQAFVRSLSPESRYLRFMSTLSELPNIMLARLTKIDYDRDMALVSVVREQTQERQVGVCRYSTRFDGITCEFAVVIADDWQGAGLARQLMNALIAAARQRGLRSMHGDVLAHNERMLKFVASLGFVVTPHSEDNGLKRVTLQLQ